MGDRLAYLEETKWLLDEEVGTLLRQSPIYESEAWGTRDQPAFYNQVVAYQTSLNPQALLVRTQAIERELGRVKTRHWGERTVDIDLLDYDGQVLHSDKLAIPHPQIQHRKFVLLPLRDVQPTYVHPVLKTDVHSLLAKTADDGHVLKLAWSADARFSSEF